MSSVDALAQTAGMSTYRFLQQAAKERGINGKQSADVLLEHCFNASCSVSPLLHSGNSASSPSLLTPTSPSVSLTGNSTMPAKVPSPSKKKVLAATKSYPVMVTTGEARTKALEGMLAEALSEIAVMRTRLTLVEGQVSQLRAAPAATDVVAASAANIRKQLVLRSQETDRRVTQNAASSAALQGTVVALENRLEKHQQDVQNVLTVIEGWKVVSDAGQDALRLLDALTRCGDMRKHEIQLVKAFRRPSPLDSSLNRPPALIISFLSATHQEVVFRAISHAKIMGLTEFIPLKAYRDKTLAQRAADRAHSKETAGRATVKFHPYAQKAGSVSVNVNSSPPRMPTCANSALFAGLQVFGNDNDVDDSRRMVVDPVDSTVDSLARWSIDSPREYGHQIGGQALIRRRLDGPELNPALMPSTSRSLFSLAPADVILVQSPPPLVAAAIFPVAPAVAPAPSASVISASQDDDIIIVDPGTVTKRANKRGGRKHKGPKVVLPDATVEGGSDDDRPTPAGHKPRYKRKPRLTRAQKGKGRASSVASTSAATIEAITVDSDDDDGDLIITPYIKEEEVSDSELVKMESQE
ncbi:hypothetical protein P7C70_g7488, partial [Phenoliferia sp. Uapishka_3]